MTQYPGSPEVHNEFPVDPNALQSPVLHETAEEVRHDRLLTIPNGMTAIRGLMAVAIPFYARRNGGGKHLTAITVATAATDMEGSVARFIEEKSPGWGVSEIGADADPGADTAFAAGVGVAHLISPRTSPVAKVAAGINLLKAGLQTSWYARANQKHVKETGERLSLPVTGDGKKGTAGMLAAASLISLTHDLNPNNPVQKHIRRAAGVGALAFAAYGLFFGEKSRAQYKQQLRERES